ncbi:hypothetical protein PV325_006509 [Microctonus aethiopoides]|nr:hypothetical protein PV325_006509 [Microctonus aethiopoides]
MFWGLIMEPNKRYTQIVENAFHVSMATLDVTTADAENVQVMLCYESRNYLLCNLSKGSHLQMPLDLCFKKGTKIAFTSNGRGHVHLTGYLLPEEDLDDFDESEDGEEEEEETEEEDVPQLVGKQAKRKAQTSPAGIKQTKRLKDQGGFMELENSSGDDTEDDSDAENESAEIAEDDSEIEEEEEEDSDEDDDDDEEEEEEEETKPQQKKNKQNKQQQAQQKQQKNQKVENQKPQKQQNNLTNGKDAKAKQVNKEEESENNSQLPKKKVVAGGLQIEEIKLGKGPLAKPGKFVAVYYVGRLKNGKKFDATTNGDGFKFRLGKGEVIRGWDVGVQGMKVGGKRRIAIPPSMAYGAKGLPPAIPGNSTLIFEVELKSVH